MPKRLPVCIQRSLIVDIVKPEEIKAAASFVSQKCEKDDLKLIAVVNNAGYPESAVLEEIPIEKLRNQFEVNVVGQVAVSQAFLPL